MRERCVVLRFLFAYKFAALSSGGLQKAGGKRKL